MIPVLLARFEAPNISLITITNIDDSHGFLSPLSTTISHSIHKTQSLHTRPLKIKLQKKIEIWNTSCIVTNFGKNQLKSACSILINPANNTLSGTSLFPYFPRFVRLLSLMPHTFMYDYDKTLSYISLHTPVASPFIINICTNVC